MVDIEIPKRLETIKEFKAEGGKVAAVLPIHYSRALFRAFKILPVEVWDPPAVETSYSGAHLQSYVCSIVHNALSFLKKGGLDITDFVLVPHACDSLQGLGSILLDFVKPKQPVAPLYLPRGKRPEDKQFLADEFRALARQLSELTGMSPSDDELLACIEREEQADSLLKALYQNRSSMDMNNWSFYRLLRSREYLPAERFTELAQDALKNNTTSKPNGIPVVLSGIVPAPMEMLNVIEELGGFVVADDFACCGRRLYPKGNEREPFLRMAERIVNAPPDPTRGNSIEERVKYLINLVRLHGAKGVIFYELKFCEPELFDLPNLRNSLKQAGVNSVHVEVDINDPLSNQVVTRIGAFLEILE
jgi:benzoyl-CoA reductase/2-hydroxyglutaryl-CoA dehydratase subunit BcrC/BadD/HgdB